MRYLTQRSSSGIWYFRYQIPARFRSFFPYGREIKKSLSTRSLTTAKLRASRLQQGLWEKIEVLERHGEQNENLSNFYSIMAKICPIEETIFHYFRGV
jgi:hypothetical protein